MNISINLAKTDIEIAACYPVILALRPDLAEPAFVTRVRHLEDSGYRLAFAQAAESIVAVAGFRIGESLAWGRFLYLDDLVTLPVQRSKGYGSALLAWLDAYAAREGCTQLHLDSGRQRKAAHRFYEREGMSATSLHFARDIR